MANIILVEGEITFESRGDNVHIQNADGSIRVAISRHDFLAGVSGAEAVRREIIGKQDNIVPLCELCIRHNLPRD